VTGTQASAATLAGRFPDAVAEGMEGAGVVAAAVLNGVPVAEVRAISNAVGPRDRAAWQIPLALESLGRAVAAITGDPEGADES
jgi:futalosine hydrolase